MDNIVWKQTLTKNTGKYECFVERIEENIGYLKILNLQNNSFIFKKEIFIKDNAIIQPEYEDVLFWEEICLEFLKNNREY